MLVVKLAIETEPPLNEIGPGGVAAWLPWHGSQLMKSAKLPKGKALAPPDPVRRGIRRDQHAPCG
jgi:hypothetical protein